MAIINGTVNNDNITGTNEDDVVFSGGVVRYTEYIQGNGGSDRLVLNEDGASYEGRELWASRIVVRDFTIDDVASNDQADVLDIGAFLEGKNLNSSNVGDYLHVVNRYGSTLMFINKEGQFTEEDRIEFDNLGTGTYNNNPKVDMSLEFQDKAKYNSSNEFKSINFEDLTGEANNTIEQFHALVNMGFLDLSASIERAESNQEVDIIGTAGADGIYGTVADENIYSGGLGGTTGVQLGEGSGDSYHSKAESIRGGGGSDRLILNADDAVFTDIAGVQNGGHIRVRDFTVGDVVNNDQADTLDLSDLLNGTNIHIDDLNNYLHIVSGVFGSQRSVIFIDKDGEFTDEKRAALESDIRAGGQGTDLFIELQGRAANNNLAEITGEADNSVEQYQALLNMGFLEIANLSSEEPTPPEYNYWAADIIGTAGADGIYGTDEGENIFSGGLGGELGIQRGVGSGDSYHNKAESIRTNGGADRLILDANDAVFTDIAGVNNGGHIRVRDFTIDDISSNREADILNLSDFLNGSNITAANLGNYLHVVSGAFGSQRTGLFIDRDGQLTDEKRAALDADIRAGGQGADIFIEFQGQATNNNFAELTGHADNTVEQFQALIDMEFLDLSGFVGNRGEIYQGTAAGDGASSGTGPLVGTLADDIFISNGIPSSSDTENVNGNGGRDIYVVNEAIYADNSRVRIRDFDFGSDSVHERDAIDLSDVLVGATRDNIGDYIDIRFNSFGFQDVMEVYFNGNAPGDGTNTTAANIRIDTQGANDGLDQAILGFSVGDFSSATYSEAHEAAVLAQMIDNGSLIID